MPYKESLPEVKPNLDTLSYAVRQVLELAWNSETAYQGIELQPNDAPSRGQCGVSSVFLSRVLSSHGFNAYFTEGIIGLDNLDEEHVWVEVQDARQDGKPLVVDITNDQYQSTNGALVDIGVYGEGIGTIGSYLPLERFSPTDIPRKKLMARYALLERNVDRIPFYKKRKQRKLIKDFTGD